MKTYIAVCLAANVLAILLKASLLCIQPHPYKREITTFATVLGMLESFLWAGWAAILLFTN